jgi:WD40 repeat protein
MLTKWSAHEKLARGVLFTPDGRGLVNSGWDGNVKYWDISPLEQAEVEGFGMQNYQNSGVKEYVPLPCALILRTLTFVYRAALLQCKLQGHRGRILSVDFSPTGEYIASGSTDTHLALWRYVAAESVATHRVHLEFRLVKDWPEGTLQHDFGRMFTSECFCEVEQDNIIDNGCNDTVL